MTDQTSLPSYPYRDGDVTVLGPEVFASADGKVISWRGQNYERQPEPAAPAEDADRVQRYARAIGQAPHARAVRRAIAVADAEQAELRAQLAHVEAGDTHALNLATSTVTAWKQKAEQAEQRADTYRAAWHSARDRARKATRRAEAALARVEAAAHDLRHEDAMRIIAALDGPAEPGTNRRDKDAELRTANEQIERLTAELAGIRDAAHLQRQGLLSTAELHAVIGPAALDPQQ